MLNKSLTKQRGMSPITMLLLLILGGFVVMSVLTMAPHYVDNQSVNNIIDGLMDEPTIADLDEGEIGMMLAKRLNMNQIRSVSWKDFYIETDPVFIGIEYEIREPLIANIDVVMSFAYPPELREQSDSE